MPFPIPEPASTVPPPSREPYLNQPRWQSRSEDWALQQVASSHLDALYRFGELAFFVLMWTPADHARGLVERCSRCFYGDRRVAEVYQQSDDARCPVCYGTTFEGGYRARIVRPGIWTDQVTDTRRQPRGTVSTDGMSIETTGDFTLHAGDYLIRAGGSRYQAQELSGAWVRAGFAVPDDVKSVAGVIDLAKLEDPASVAYLIPPVGDTADDVLRSSLDEHLAADMSSFEDVRGPLITG